jgi:hypothetical protein
MMPSNVVATKLYAVEQDIASAILTTGFSKDPFLPALERQASTLYEVELMLTRNGRSITISSSVVVAD